MVRKITSGSRALVASGLLMVAVAVGGAAGCGGGSPSQPGSDAGEWVCDLPIEPGSCRAYIPSFGFDSEAQRCVSFIYGGCEGNENRFETLEECQLVCGG